LEDILLRGSRERGYDEDIKCAGDWGIIEDLGYERLLSGQLISERVRKYLFTLLSADSIFQF